MAVGKDRSREKSSLLRAPHVEKVAAQMEEEGRAFANRLGSQEFRDAVTKLLEPTPEPAIAEERRAAT